MEKRFWRTGSLRNTQARGTATYLSSPWPPGPARRPWCARWRPWGTRSRWAACHRLWWCAAGAGPERLYPGKTQCSSRSLFSMTQCSKRSRTQEKQFAIFGELLVSCLKKGSTRAWVPLFQINIGLKFNDSFTALDLLLVPLPFGTALTDQAPLSRTGISAQATWTAGKPHPPREQGANEDTGGGGGMHSQICLF